MEVMQMKVKELSIYDVTYTHRHGVDHYIIMLDHMPSKEEVCELLELDFEPEREFLEVGTPQIRIPRSLAAGPACFAFAKEFGAHIACETKNIEVPSDSWEMTGTEDDPSGSLLATVIINGVDMHLEAIAVEKVGDLQVPVADLQDVYDKFYDAAGADGNFQTVTINGRDYALFSSPFCM